MFGLKKTARLLIIVAIFIPCFDGHVSFRSKFITKSISRFEHFNFFFNKLRTSAYTEETFKNGFRLINFVVIAHAAGYYQTYTISRRATFPYY